MVSHFLLVLIGIPVLYCSFIDIWKYLYADENRELIKSETLIISNS